MSSAPKRYLRPAKFAERAGVSVKTLYAWMARGLLPRPHKVGGAALMDEAWLELLAR